MADTRGNLVPGWLVGLLVVGAYLGSWGTGFSVIATAHPTNRVDALRVLEWTWMSLSGLGLAGTLLAAPRLTSGKARAAVAAAAAVGAMLTIVVALVAGADAVDLRAAFTVVPAAVAAAGLGQVSIASAILGVLLRGQIEDGKPAPQSSRHPRWVRGTVGASVLLSVVTAVVLGGAVLAAAIHGQGSTARLGLQWGGALSFVLVVTQLAVGLGIWQAGIPQRAAAG